MSGDVEDPRRRSRRVAATHGLERPRRRRSRRYVGAAARLATRQRDRAHRPVAVVDTLIGDSLALLDGAAAARARRRRLARPGRRRRHPRHPAGGRPARGAHHPARRGGQEVRVSRGGRRTASGLGERADVVCARSERYAAAGAPGREAHAVVLARAVAELPCWSSSRRRCSPRTACCWRARRGRALREERAAADAAAESAAASPSTPSVPLSASPLDDAVCAVYRKVAPAPDWLPRREGMAAKRPLTS